MAPAVSSPREAQFRQARRMVFAGVGVAAVTTLVYLFVLSDEGDRLVNPFSVLLVAAQVASLLGGLAGNRRLIGAGATLLSLLGLLGLASIGLPLLLGAGLLWAAVALLR
jgi:hypothetical protein